MLRKSSQTRDSLKKPFLIHAGVKLFPIGTHPFFGAAAYPCGQFGHMDFLCCNRWINVLWVTANQCGQFVHIDFSCRNEQINVRFTSCRQNVHMRRIAVLPVWISCPLPAAFSGSPAWGSSPGIPCRRSCGFQGPTGKTATKKPSQNRPALPSLFLEGHASRLCNG